MKNIAKLISKFNILTLVLLVIAYIGCLTLILIAVNPKYSYKIEPQYEHDISFSEISNTYQIIYRRSLEGEKISESYAIRTSINARTSDEDNTDPKLVISSFQSEFVEANGKETYFSDVTSATTTWARTSSYGEGHEPLSFYGRIKYIDGNGEEKLKTFKEKILSKPTSINKYGNGNVINIKDASFAYQVISSKLDNEYSVSMRVTSNTDKPFHIDLQTWILDQGDNLLPFVGVYNYNNRNWSVSSEKIINELKPKAIVCKAICYYNGEDFELDYKVNFSEMKQAYVDYENVEAKRIDPESHKTTNKVIAFCLLGSFALVIIGIVVVAFIRIKGKKNQIQEAGEQAQNEKNIDINDNN